MCTWLVRGTEMGTSEMHEHKNFRHLQLQEHPGVWSELPQSTAGESQLCHTHPKGHPGQECLQWIREAHKYILTNSTDSCQLPGATGQTYVPTHHLHPEQGWAMVTAVRIPPTFPSVRHRLCSSKQGPELWQEGKEQDGWAQGRNPDYRRALWPPLPPTHVPRMHKLGESISTVGQDKRQTLNIWSPVGHAAFNSWLLILPWKWS